MEICQVSLYQTAVSCHFIC